MKLNEYEWSRNPRGMHNALATIPVNFDANFVMKMGWIKLNTFTTLYVKDIKRFLGAGMTPIVRVFEPKLGNKAPTAPMMTLYREYFDAGARWFELYNEPNLVEEWEGRDRVDWRDTAGIIGPMMENWLNWAETILSWGGYPAFPALSETILEQSAAVKWMEAMLGYLRDNVTRFDRFRAIANSGLWVATHPYIFNHFYQEGSNPRTPRPPGLLNAFEPGWHFEYPYDPLSQSSDPGRTVFGGTPKTPYGDPTGLIAMGIAFMTWYADWFGGGAVPVIGTEGGIFPVPRDGNFYQADTRYPPYDQFSHAEATVAMFKWIAEVAPPWFFGVCLWKEDDYFSPSPANAVVRLQNTPAPVKDVPPLETIIGPGIPNLRGWKGPGPIHGAPDFHFLVIGPGFPAEWFFDRGRGYYEVFRPQIMSDFSYIANLDYRKSLGVTLLTLPNLADQLKAQITDRYSGVWVDVVAVDTPDSLERTLTERTLRGLRFG